MLITTIDPDTAEVLHYVLDALGSVVALTDAGDPDAQPDRFGRPLRALHDGPVAGVLHRRDAGATRGWAHWLPLGL